MKRWFCLAVTLLLMITCCGCSTRPQTSDRRNTAAYIARNTAQSYQGEIQGISINAEVHVPTEMEEAPVLYAAFSAIDAQTVVQTLFSNMDGELQSETISGDEYNGERLSEGYSASYYAANGEGPVFQSNNMSHTFIYWAGGGAAPDASTEFQTAEPQADEELLARNFLDTFMPALKPEMAYRLESAMTAKGSDGGEITVFAFAALYRGIPWYRQSYYVKDDLQGTVVDGKRYAVAQNAVSFQVYVKDAAVAGARILSFPEIVRETMQNKLLTLEGALDALETTTFNYGFPVVDTISFAYVPFKSDTGGNRMFYPMWVFSQREGSRAPALHEGAYAIFVNAVTGEVIEAYDETALAMQG